MVEPTIRRSTAYSMRDIDQSKRDGRTAYRRPTLSYVERRPQTYFDGVSPIVFSSSPGASSAKRRHSLVKVAPQKVEPVHVKIPRPEQVVAVDEALTEHKVIEEQKKRPPFFKKHRYQLAAAALIVVGVGVSLQGILMNAKASEQVKAMAAGEQTAQTNQLPSEDPPVKGDATKGYVVAATSPRVITIGKFGVKARVLALGTNDKNEIDTPKNIYDTAWYTGSSKPGDQGAMLLSGHVSGPTKHGVFYDIKRLVPGDEIGVERGDAKRLVYSVVSVETTPADKVDMLRLVNSAVPGKSGLNLITCGGGFDTKTNEFTDRTVVYSVLRS